jgi:hypothetical protein
MRPFMMRRHWIGLGILLGVLLGGTKAPAQVSGPALPEAWTAVRQALEKYQDPIVAVRDGYHSTLGCVAV